MSSASTAVSRFNHLVKGDGDLAEKHRDFYDEYLSVMDLDAAYFMQTVETVFIRHSLPKGEMTHRGQRVDLTAIRNCGLLTIEGEKDDISGVGQTYAANELCVNIPEWKRLHHMQLEVGITAFSTAPASASRSSRSFAVS